MIRPVTEDDLPALKAVIGATQLFPPELLDGMVAEYLAGDRPMEQLWLTDDDGGPLSVAYCAPERMTEGTWNLYLIAVHPDRQRRGSGAALLHHVERAVAERGGRLMLVETSGLPEFAGTRAFYLARSYGEEARIRDFYQSGEDKIVFRKKLPSVTPRE